jgi:transposase
VKFVKGYFPGSKVTTAYEAGFSGFVLHRTLEQHGIKNVVVHAAGMEVSPDRVKTDKRDSEKLATKLDKGDLKGIRIPSREEEASRVLQRTREQLVATRSSLKVQIQMKLYQFGYRATERNEQLTLARVEKGLQEPLPEELKAGIRALVAIWKALNSQIREIERKEREQAAKDARDEVYRSLPGYGFHTSRILSTELGDMSQFSNERRLFSFLGLTPAEWSTGTRERKGPISKQGSGRLRAILIEAAWTAVRTDAELRRSFDKLAQRTGKKRAIVAIARRLIGRARALFRKGELYKSQRALKRAA